MEILIEILCVLESAHRGGGGRGLRLGGELSTFKNSVRLVKSELGFWLFKQRQQL